MNLNITEVKIIFTAPEENVNDIIKELCDAGAGIIGNYSHCSTSEKCVGTFMGNEKSNPYVGEKNKFEIVNEVKVEIKCNVQILKNVLKKLRKTHPYEEPAIDIIPLINEEDLEAL